MPEITWLEAGPNQMVKCIVRKEAHFLEPLIPKLVCLDIRIMRVIG